MTSSIFYGAEAVQYLAIFFGCLNVINSGMVYGWPSASLPQLLYSNSTARLTPFEGFCLATAPLFGSMIFAPIACTLTDIIGPKRTLTHTFYPYLFSWILIALFKDFELLLLGRLLSGVADSCLFNSFTIYIGDIYSQTSKFKLYSLYPICFSLGILLINILENISTIIFAASIGGILTSLSFSGMLIMPESPYYYTMKNKNYQAKEAIRWIKGRESIDEVFSGLQKDTVHKDMTVLEILKTAPGRFIMISFILVSAQQLTGISALVFFITTILKNANVEFYFDSEISFILFSLLLFITILITFLSESRENKNLLLCSTMGTGIALVVNGLYFQYFNSKNDNTLLRLIPVTALMVYIISYGLGLNNLPFVMLNENFPRYAIAKILGITHFYSALLAIIVCLIFYIFNNSMRIYIPFYFFSVSCFICFLLIWYFLPNTLITCEEAISLIDSCKEKSVQNYDLINGSFEISDYSDE